MSCIYGKSLIIDKLKVMLAADGRIHTAFENSLTTAVAKMSVDMFTDTDSPSDFNRYLWPLIWDEDTYMAIGLSTDMLGIFQDTLSVFHNYGAHWVRDGGYMIQVRHWDLMPFMSNSTLRNDYGAPGTYIKNWGVFSYSRQYEFKPDEIYSSEFQTRYISATINEEAAPAVAPYLNPATWETFYFGVEGTTNYPVTIYANIRVVDDNDQVMDSVLLTTRASAATAELWPGLLADAGHIAPWSGYWEGF